MRHSLFLTFGALVLVAVDGMAASREAATRPVIVHHEEGVLQSSAGTHAALLQRESAGPDTFDLYGGARRLVRDPDGIPGSGDEYVEGKFEDPSGFLPRGLSPSPGDWTGADRTDVPNHWQVSTFNAANLNANGAGNRAMWAGLDATDPGVAGWQAAPGYGNRWNDMLLFESDPVVDSSAGQTVTLDFVFNLDVEPAYDFFHVEYDSAGTWTSVYVADGTNKDSLTGVFPVPGLRFSEVQTRAIVYAGNDYGLDGRIRIRWRFVSDYIYSDEDGNWDTDGAVQFDDVSITERRGTFAEDFEGSEPFLLFRDRAPFAGDWSSVFPAFSDLDPCAENTTPQVGFLDFGQTPPNAPGTTGVSSTGGSLSSVWDYGVPGGWVVNYTGGLDGVDLANEVWSPEFEWNLPGVTDDGADVFGSELRFSVWRHNPLLNAIFYVWHVRTYADGIWSPWVDRNFVYFSTSPEYNSERHDTTTLIKAYPEKVQVALGLADLAETFGFPGSDATPSPMFDDVRFRKFRVAGPALSTRTIDTANDGFPVGGSIDVSTQAARDALDVRFDMARDISSGDANVPGDSVIVDVVPVIPGTTLQTLTMKWALKLNPLFEDAIRTLPARAQDIDVQDTFDAEGHRIWTGAVVTEESRHAASGNVIQDRYFADLPDEDFLYPGDVLHYHFEATDDDGRVSTLPSDTRGFGEWGADGRSTYARAWTVRALPSIVDASGDQPEILVWNDFGRRGGEAEFLSAFGQLGLFEGLDYDTYTTQGPTSGVSNGLGSAGEISSLGDRRGHGANADQLAGYDAIVYLSGNLNTQLMSNGSYTGQNDKSDDLGVMTAWKDLPGRRSTVHFGDYVASALNWDSVDGSIYVQTVMGVDLIASDVRSRIDGQTSPQIEPTAEVSGFFESFVAYGGCFGINQFDAIRPSTQSVRSHGFVDPTTAAVYPDVAAGVIFDRLVATDRKIDITFPFGFLYVYDDISRSLPQVSARAELLEEVLTYMGGFLIIYDPVPTPSPRAAWLRVHPTPFNPTTVVEFALPRAGVPARVEVFDVRGQRVRTLYDGTAAAADLRLTWNGTDDRGAQVGSGIYLVRAVTEGFGATRKAVLVK